MLRRADELFALGELPFAASPETHSLWDSFLDVSVDHLKIWFHSSQNYCSGFLSQEKGLAVTRCHNKMLELEVIKRT